MTKPTNLFELRGAGVISDRDVGLIAAGIFDGVEAVSDIEGYVITLPKYEELPDACQQFIRKALMFSAVRNVLDGDDPLPSSWTDDDELYTQADIDAHGTADRD